jgi:hypothetical protein
MSDPNIDPREKSRLVKDLMAARRAVKDANGAGDHGAENEAHRMVDEAKRALGDGAPDLNRHAVKNTHYAIGMGGRSEQVRVAWAGRPATANRSTMLPRSASPIACAETPAP